MLLGRIFIIHCAFVLCFWIVAERDVCFGDISIGHNIVRCAVIENCSPLSCLSELMTAQHEGYLSSLQLKVFRIQLQALSKSGVCILQVFGISGLAGSPKKGNRQFVVGLHLLRIRPDLQLCR